MKYMSKWNIDEDTEGKLESARKELSEKDHELDNSQFEIKKLENRIKDLEGGVIT